MRHALVLGMVVAACGRGTAQRAESHADATPADAAPSDAAADAAGRRLLRVRLHEAAPGAAAATLAIDLDEPVEIASWDGAPRRLAPEYRLAVGMQTLEIDGLRVLVPLLPGDELSLVTGAGGWLLRSERVRRAVEKAPAICDARRSRCGPGQIEWRVDEGDGPHCPDDGRAHRCIVAPLVRLRGPWSGKALAGDSDVQEPVKLAPRGLVAGQLGAWVPLYIDADGTRPWVSLGDARAALLMGPGERWQVGRNPDGSVGAELVSR